MAFDDALETSNGIVRINLLGDLEVLRDDVAVDLPPSKKTRALLAYLVHAGKQIRRERLCELFWEIPDDPRGALRWSLSKIRQFVPDGLETDRNTVRIDRTSLKCDLDLLGRLAPGNLESISTGELETAAAAFRGPFLADLSLPRCPEFEAWRVAIANELEVLRIGILSLLIDRLADEPSRALLHAHVLQSLLPEDEALARRTETLNRQAREAAGRETSKPEPATEQIRYEDPETPTQPETQSDPNSAILDFAERFRAHVTVLAIDIVNASQSFEDYDPESGQGLVEKVQADIRQMLENYSASILGIGNGEIVAAFGIDNRSEDHAYFACRAALEARLITEKTELNMVRFRAGLDTGEVVARRTGSTQSEWEVTGAALRRARRIAGGLEHDGIALTSRTREMAGGYVTAERLDSEHAGLPENDDTLWLLSRENRAQSRWHLRANKVLSQLYGRETELQVLHAAWRKVRTGDGVVIGIVADPGVGKSRLTHEFCAAITEDGARVMECGALEPDRNSSYLAIRKIISSLCRIDGQIGAEQARERLTRLMDLLGIDSFHRPALEFLVNLETLDAQWNALAPDERARRILDAVRALLVGEVNKGPYVILVEDMHWMDPESERIFRKFANTVVHHPVLLIGTCRPNYRVDWLTRNHCQMLRINRFSQLEMEGLVDVMVGDDRSLGEVRDLLIKQSDGTPLFAEEAIRKLLDTGVISGKPGAYRLTGEFTGLSIPSTIQSVISSRIARLYLPQRMLLQIAAVIGRDVPDWLLRAVSQFQPEVYDHAIEALLADEFIYEVQSYPVVEYRMKHALARRVAYGMLLAQDRSDLHRRVLEQLEKMHGNQRENHAEMLADHAFNAGLWAEAADYLLMAVGKSARNTGSGVPRRLLEKAAHANRQLPAGKEQNHRSSRIAALATELGLPPEISNEPVGNAA